MPWGGLGMKEFPIEVVASIATDRLFCKPDDLYACLSFYFGRPVQTIELQDLMVKMSAELFLGPLARAAESILENESEETAKDAMLSHGFSSVMRIIPRIQSTEGGQA